MSSFTQLTPLQAGAAIALGFGLNLSAVAAEFKVHRFSIHNWAKNSEFIEAAETCQADFDASPSVRLKAALAVLKQDWKLPHSTDFDTLSQPSESLRNEMAPQAQSAPVDTYRHPGPNEINNVRNETPSGSEPGNNIGRNEPCPCGSKLKYKRCCGSPTRLAGKFRHPDPNEIDSVRNEMPAA